MNITLSADEKLIAKSREYAKTRNTTLNGLIRDYLRQVGGEKDAAECAAEFVELTKKMAGESDSSFRFDRDALYDRV